MKALILSLLVLAGCVTHAPYPDIYADPDAPPINCGNDAVAVVEKHGGGRLKSVGGERWHCQDVDDFDDQEEYEDWED